MPPGRGPGGRGGRGGRGREGGGEIGELKGRRWCIRLTEVSHEGNKMRWLQAVFSSAGLLCALNAASILGCTITPISAFKQGAQHTAVWAALRALKA